MEIIYLFLSTEIIYVRLQLLKMIKPRLVFGGHTHYGCHIQHSGGIHEYSLSSFNWRNKYNPTYMLVSLILT